jgi:hypothetical protein
MKKSIYTKPTSRVLRMNVTNQLLQSSVPVNSSSHTSGNYSKRTSYEYEPEPEEGNQ